MRERDGTKGKHTMNKVNSGQSEVESVDLFLRYMDGITSRTEDREVRERIHKSQSERTLFVQIAEQHGQLFEIAGSQLHAEDLDAILHQKRNGSSRVLRFIPKRTLPAAAAAVLVLAGGLFLWPQTQSRSEFARVEQSVGNARVLRNGKAHAIRPGMRLFNADLLAGEDEDEWTIRFPQDGTHLALSRSPMLRLAGQVSAQHLILDQGRMEAIITPRATDAALVVDTPHGRIQVKGTHFVAITDQGSTRVRVLEGTVEVNRFSDGRTATINAGHYAVMNASLGALPSGEFQEGQIIEGRVLLQETFEDQDSGRWIAGIIDLEKNETYLLDSAADHIRHVERDRNGASTRCVELTAPGKGKAVSLHHADVTFPKCFSMELEIFTTQSSEYAYFAYDDPESRQILYRHPKFDRIRNEYRKPGKWMHFTIHWRDTTQETSADTAVVEWYFGSTLMLRQALTGSNPLALRFSCNSGRIYVDNVVLTEHIPFE